MPDKPSSGTPLAEAANTQATQHSGDFGIFVWDAGTGLLKSVLGFRHHAALRAVEFVNADTIVSGDLNGLVLQWSVSKAMAVRRLMPVQARSRALLIAPPGSQPRPSGAGANDPIMITGSDVGPPLVAHALTPLAEPPRAQADGDDELPPQAREGDQLELLPGEKLLPRRAINSLFSATQTAEYLVTGHERGEIYMWRRQGGALVHAMGTAGSGLSKSKISVTRV
jgi:WD40 repeat protein